MHIYIGFDDTDTLILNGVQGNWPVGLRTNCPKHVICGVLFANNFCWMIPSPIPPITVLPVRF